MKTETHTPGPWFWSESHPKNACVLILANVEWGECNIATLHCAPSDDAKQDENGVWGDHPERRSNARLIAAAPDLLEALRPFADIGISENPDYQPMIRLDRDAILAARAAIDKAEGRA